MTFDRKQIPNPTAPRPFHFPDFDRFFLDNGLEVLVVNRNHLPLVGVNLCIRSSALHDEKGLEGTANLLSELLPEGTATKNSEQIADLFEYIAANFSVHADWSGIHMDLNTVSKHLPTAMELFAEILFEPSFPEKELERLRTELLTERMRVIDNPAKLNAEHFIHRIYGEHRYGTTVDGSRESLQQISRDAIKRFYQTHFVPRNAALIFAGDIVTSAAAKLAQQFFGNWQDAPLPPQFEHQFKEPEQTSVTLIDKPGAAQCELRMGHLGLERSNPDYYAVTLMNEILGGYFLSRINMNLREQNGFTYGAGSAFNYRSGLGPFHVSSAIQSEHITAAISEVLAEIEIMRSELVSKEELNNARGQLIGLFPIAFETADQVALGLSNIILNQLPDDYYNTYADNLRKVTREDILRVAQTYLHPQQMQVVVTGDSSVVATGLEERFPLQVIQP